MNYDDAFTLEQVRVVCVWVPFLEHELECFPLSNETYTHTHTNTHTHKVDESLLDNFNSVAGIVPILTTHIAEVQQQLQVGFETGS